MTNDVRRHREEGSALLVAVLLMVFMGIIGLAAMETASRDRTVAGLSKRSRIAFFAAEAGAHTGLNLIRLTPTRFSPPTLPTTSLGLAADYPYTSQPQFMGDPAQAQPIRWLRDTPMPGFGLGPGTTGFTVSYWVVNSLGNGPNGGVARVEVGKRVPSFSGFGS